VWRKPKMTEAFNAPMLYTAFPLSSFQRIVATMSADWKTLYDQGGLILAWDGANGQKKWIKAGIEFYKGKPFVAVVGTDIWSDWSLLPLPKGTGKATVEMAREKDGSLWVYWVAPEGRTPIREVTWAFEDEEGRECWAGIYAAQPAADAPALDVDFEDIAVEHN